MDFVLTCSSQASAARHMLQEKCPGLIQNLGLRDVGTEKRGCDEEGHIQRMRRAKTCSKPPLKDSGEMRRGREGAKDSKES